MKGIQIDGKYYVPVRSLTKKLVTLVQVNNCEVGAVYQSQIQARLELQNVGFDVKFVDGRGWSADQSEWPDSLLM